MKSFMSMLITIALVGVVSMSLLSFGYVLQLDNNANGTIMDDSSMAAFNRTIQSGLEDFRDRSAGLKNATNSEQLEEPVGDLTLGSIFSSGLTFTGFIFSFPIAFFNTVKINLGISFIVLNVLISIISLVAIFKWWRLLKQGE